MTRSAFPACIALALLVAPCAANAKTPPTLSATVGPGFTIALKDQAGKRVSRLQAGRYTVVVRDRTGTDAHNLRLKGPGVDRRTGVGYVGTVRWSHLQKRRDVQVLLRAA